LFTLKDVQAQAKAHDQWLTARQIPRIAKIAEPQFTGVIIATLLDASVAPTVLKALGVTSQDRLTRVISDPVPIDIVVTLATPKGEDYSIFMEVKRWGSPSNAPGYKNEDYTQWQTDLMHAMSVGYARCPNCGFDRMCSACRRCWCCGTGRGHNVPSANLTERKKPEWLTELRGVVPPSPLDRYLLIDMKERTMDQAFPHGVCNDKWEVISINDIAKELKGKQEGLGKGQQSTSSMPGLYGLLGTVYADARLN
jgi:hypothetical protein